MKLFLILGCGEDWKNPWKDLSTGTPFRLSSFWFVSFKFCLYLYSTLRGSSFLSIKWYLREGSGAISALLNVLHYSPIFHKIGGNLIKFFILTRVYCKERTRGSRRCCSSLLLNILFLQRLKRWHFVVDLSKSACHPAYDHHFYCL